MNIIWQQPNETLAVTSIFDGSDPVEHAQLLQSRGDVPSDWVVVATDYQGSFPNTPQEYWRWDGGIVSNHVPPAVQSCTPWQIRKALNAQGLRDAAESAVSSSADQSLKDGWQFANEFRSDDPFVIAMGAALGKSEEEAAQLIQYASTL